MAGRIGFRWRQLAHDLGNGLLFRPSMITAGIAITGLVLIELERSGTLPRWEGGGWFFQNDPGSAQTVLGAISRSTSCASMVTVISPSRSDSCRRSG